MSLTIEEVEHIARLARLELSESEKDRYRVQLSAILDHVAQLQKLDTTAIEPMAGVFLAESPLREDKSRPGMPTATLLESSADQDRAQFKIPPVFE